MFKPVVNGALRHMDRDAATTGANPGRHLQDFYAVVLGLGLVLAVEQVIDAGEGDPVEWSGVPLFLAFATLAFSYYHGSVRYLDVMYGSDSPSLGRGRITSDLVIGAVDLTLLITLAALSSRPIYFTGLLIALMCFEIGRVGVMTILLSRDQLTKIERDFTWINALTVGPLAIIFLVGLRTSDIETQRLVTGIPLFLLMVARTVLSYRRSFDFYFAGATEVGGNGRQTGGGP